MAAASSFFRVFRDGEHFHLHGALAEGELDLVADLHVIRRLGRPAVDRDVLTVTGIVCHGAALDEPRNFQIFVQAHRHPPVKNAPGQARSVCIAYLETASLSTLPALKKTGLSKKDSEKAVNATFDTITANLEVGEKVQLVGFGVFDIKERGSRIGRNPKTKEEIEIPAMRSVLPYS